MGQQQVKNHIRDWIKSNNVLASHIGDIRLGRQIGEGGTALVFESDFMGGTAIKFLGEPLSPSPSTRYKRFLSEYTNLVQMVPSGVVVPLYHFGVQEMGELPIPFIVMELCDRTLYECYRDDKLQDADEFRGLVLRLLAILESIHDAGIVHRDIKPKNILLRPNGDWVLADFGISWFDPQFYEVLAQTRRGDRLANWQFSPPEQFRRDGYDQATPCLDLYALGQTLYYCATGHVIKGTNHPLFAEVAPTLKEYDCFVNKLVRQNPQERFQSAAEARDFLSEQEYEDEFNRDERRLRRHIQQVTEFDKRLARAMPGSAGFSRYTQAASRSEIDRVMSVLADDPEQCNLWWTRGLGDMYVERIEQWSDEIWLINHSECLIADLWLYRHVHRYERQYVIIQLAPREPFEVRDIECSEDEVDIAGYFQGRYVSYDEYWDGYTVLDGEVVEIAGAEKRSRNLRDDFWILAPGTSVYFQHRVGYEVIHPVYISLCEAKKITPELLRPLEDIRRPIWMSIWD